MRDALIAPSDLFDSAGEVGRGLAQHPTIGRYPNVFRNGPDGYALTFGKGHRQTTSVIVTRAEHDGAEWIHASIAHPDRLPTYGELCALHEAVFGDGFAFQVFVGGSKHVNIHEYALHLWGRDDGVSPLPDFGKHGTI